MAFTICVPPLASWLEQLKRRSGRLLRDDWGQTEQLL
jgi:hypothetical protein